MMGNVALDVVIGLVFIYLLYSLYATIIMEILSSYFGLRARNLRYALRRMLMDEVKDTRGTRIVNSFKSITGKASNLGNPELFERFFAQPSIKYLGSGGVNNKPSYITAETFSSAIIDSIVISDDPDISLLARIEMGVKGLPDSAAAGEPVPSDTKKHLQSLLDKANNDLAKFKILLEEWFTETMDRASGWFKRTTQLFLSVIGLTIAISFNVDTLNIIRKLSNDTDARDQLVKMATDFTERNASQIEAIKTDQTLAANTLRERLDSLQNIKTRLERDIQDSQNILSAGWSTTATPDGVFLYIVFHFWGYLFTALAISLGAPFWFDLLNKLVKLRSSKAIDTGSPTGGASTPAISKRSILNRAG